MISRGPIKSLSPRKGKKILPRMICMLIFKAKFTLKKDDFTQSPKICKKVTTGVVHSAKRELLGIPTLLGQVLLPV